MHQFLVIDKDNKCRRLDCHLGHIVDLETIDAVIENNSMRVATGVLNEIVTEAVAMQQPPSDKGKRLIDLWQTLSRQNGNKHDLRIWHKG